MSKERVRIFPQRKIIKVEYNEKYKSTYKKFKESENHCKIFYEIKTSLNNYESILLKFPHIGQYEIRYVDNIFILYFSGHLTVTELGTEAKLLEVMEYPLVFNAFIFSKLKEAIRHIESK